MTYVVKDMAGQAFGAWTVVSRAEGKNGKRAYWNCLCKCGTEKSVLGSNLRNGVSKSCGCGLHCESNLQLLAKELNHQKRHYFWPDRPI